jgi:hypothetical protein
MELKCKLLTSDRTPEKSASDGWDICFSLRGEQQSYHRLGGASFVRISNWRFVDHPSITFSATFRIACYPKSNFRNWVSISLR